LHELIRSSHLSTNSLFLSPPRVLSRECTKRSVGQARLHIGLEAKVISTVNKRLPILHSHFSRSGTRPRTTPSLRLIRTVLSPRTADSLQQHSHHRNALHNLRTGLPSAIHHKRPKNLHRRQGVLQMALRVTTIFRQGMQGDPEGGGRKIRR
jgi:hypothetical protein